MIVYDMFFGAVKFNIHNKVDNDMATKWRL